MREEPVATPATQERSEMTTQEKTNEAESSRKLREQYSPHHCGRCARLFENQVEVCNNCKSTDIRLYYPGGYSVVSDERR